MSTKTVQIEALKRELARKILEKLAIERTIIIDEDRIDEILEKLGLTSDKLDELGLTLYDLTQDYLECIVCYDYPALYMLKHPRLSSKMIDLYKDMLSYLTTYGEYQGLIYNSLDILSIPIAYSVMHEDSVLVKGDPLAYYIYGVAKHVGLKPEEKGDKYIIELGEENVSMERIYCNYDRYNRRVGVQICRYYDFS